MDCVIRGYVALGLVDEERRGKVGPDDTGRPVRDDAWDGEKLSQYPVTTAAPTPRATARPPTRPTYAAAFTLVSRSALAGVREWVYYLCATRGVEMDDIAFKG